MSKGHRDNHAARKKRGPETFQKKAERRAIVLRCNICGGRSKKLQAGLCGRCLMRSTG